MNAMKGAFPGRALRGVAAIAIRLAVRPPLIAVAVISLAALEVAGFDPVSTAFAQTPAPVTLTGLFEPEIADLKTTEQLKDAVKKAHRDCYPPRAKFTIVVPGGSDSVFDEALARARVAALQLALPSLGLEPGQFKVNYVIGVVDGVLVSYDKFTPDDDKDAPKLKVTSIPTKGTKVKAGDKIKVTIRASERYEDGHKSWPTGVQSIQLTADDGLVDSKDYGRVPQPCERRTFEATYTVPRNPPPIVHLTAIAEDGVGNQDSEVGEFPTGDMWSGTLHAKSSQFFGPLGGQCIDEEWDINLDLVVLSDGSVTGKGSGQLVAMPKCSGGSSSHRWRYDLEGHTISCPGIRGRFDGKEFELQFPVAYPGEEHGTLGGILSLSGYPPGQNPPTLDVKVIGPGMARGQTMTDVNMGAPRHATGNFIIALKCANCSK
ncbi:MAG TPA: hypothetical protein VNY07_09685 [Chthoniobacterales bacterium]|jgi:hypothetical protein|nr:hypothetical protein [Chthoniobacterales bacterium]